MPDLGYSGPCIWRPVAIAERNLSNVGLVPLQTIDKSPHLFIKNELVSLESGRMYFPAYHEDAVEKKESEVPARALSDHYRFVCFTMFGRLERGNGCGNCNI